MLIVNCYIYISNSFSYILDIITEVAQYNNLTGIHLDDHWSVPIQFGNKVEAMNKLMGKVRQHLKKVNPKLKLSISPNPYHFSLNKYNQDWLQSTKKGYVDELVLQIYRPTSERFITSINSSDIKSG